MRDYHTHFYLTATQGHVVLSLISPWDLNKHALVVCRLPYFVLANRDHKRLISLTGICFNKRCYMFIHVNEMKRGFRGRYRRKWPQSILCRRTSFYSWRREWTGSELWRIICPYKTWQFIHFLFCLFVIFLAIAEPSDPALMFSKQKPLDASH